MATATPSIIDVTDETFGTAVLEESMRRPVVVDFWADWCQPCKVIGPVLERLADEKRGAFLLAKLDVEANRQTAGTFGIMSIPAVKAFRNARLVEEFVGAIPEAAIRQFLDVVVPSEADLVAAEGEVARRSRATRTTPSARSTTRSSAIRRTSGRRWGWPGSPPAGATSTARGRILTALRPEPEAERILAALDVSEWANDAGVGAIRSSPARCGRPPRAGSRRRWSPSSGSFWTAAISANPRARRC